MWWKRCNLRESHWTWQKSFWIWSKWYNLKKDVEYYKTYSDKCKKNKEKKEEGKYKSHDSTKTEISLILSKNNSTS